VVVGADTKLDRELGSLHCEALPTSRLIFAPNAPFKPTSRYFALIGDFIITADLKKNMALEIDEYFRSTHHLTTRSIQEVVSIFVRPSPVLVSLTRHAPAARKLRKSFQNLYARRYRSSVSMQ
jgi:hypothetical protein